MPTIALLVESARGYGRGVLSGAAQYVQSHGRLNILHQAFASDEGLPKWLTSQRCDGILASIETPETFRALQVLNVPLVLQRYSILRSCRFRDSMAARFRHWW